MYDIDLFDAPQSTIDSLHAAGKIVICYFSAGSFEDWRPDADLFEEELKSKQMDGWNEVNSPFNTQKQTNNGKNSNFVLFLFVI
jgi:hypothetical protein